MLENDKLTLLISSPDTKVNGIIADSIKILCYDGEMMVLPQHESITVLLKIDGIIEVTQNNINSNNINTIKKLIFKFINGGIVNINNNICTVISTIFEQID
ncbi:hypothetical protein [Lyticum sinuosum]|uniref:ATP synthase epsilon chain n=1 Tax=Lyticum sinuosum TaxID=1332059 RepID=A0AAE5AHI1_9RICK|nr:hypothetical protein [Lyticum sinuosum]MDZ5761595.1 ATP synthase epsilon chain [Lyticum sinuosum]